MYLASAKKLTLLLPRSRGHMHIVVYVYTGWHTHACIVIQLSPVVQSSEWIHPSYSLIHVLTFSSKVDLLSECISDTVLVGSLPPSDD